MMNWTARVFLKGLLAILPIAITLFLIYWLASALERVLGAAVRWALPEGWYVPGMGVVVGITLILALGVLLQTWLIRRVWRWGESLLDMVPLVRFFYRAIKQVVDYLSGAATDEAQQVVVASIGDPPVELLGFVTREDFDDLPEGIGGEDIVAVFLPMSYQMGGFTVMLPRDRLRPIDMRLEEGLQFALTAGVSMRPGNGALSQQTSVGAAEESDEQSSDRSDIQADNQSPQ